MAYSIFVGRLSGAQRKALIERLWHAQGGWCFITGKEIDLSLHESELDIDHVIPLTNGGKFDESNFALTFSSANRSKQGADLNPAILLFLKYVELSSTGFGGKSNHDFWKKLFTTGKSPQGEKILAVPLDITSMIISLGLGVHGRY